MLDDYLFKKAINCANEGITIVDMLQDDQPIIFVNPAFEKMTGYTSNEIIGKNCRFLHGHLKSQNGLEVIRNALKNQVACKVCLINFTKNGVKFYNELSIAPIFDTTGALIYYVGIQENITDKILRENELRKKSGTDWLTHLFNRRALNNHWKNLYKEAQSQEIFISVVIIDIDDFKDINDSYGHDAGDKALKAVAESLKLSHRKNDFIARLGGDEFCIILSNDKLLDVKKYISKKRLEIQKHIEEKKLPFSIKISMGCATRESLDRNSLHQMIEEADNAMYTDKGRNKKA